MRRPASSCGGSSPPSRWAFSCSLSRIGGRCGVLLFALRIYCTLVCGSHAFSLRVQCSHYSCIIYAHPAGTGQPPHWLAASLRAHTTRWFSSWKTYCVICSGCKCNQFNWSSGPDLNVPRGTRRPRSVELSCTVLNLKEYVSSIVT